MVAKTVCVHVFVTDLCQLEHFLTFRLLFALIQRLSQLLLSSNLHIQRRLLSLTDMCDSRLMKLRYLPVQQKRYSWRAKAKSTTHTSISWETAYIFCKTESLHGCTAYSPVRCWRQNISCCSHSSVEQSSITRHCCPLSPSSAVILNHISPHFLIPLSDSSLICTVPCPRSDSSFWTL